jgi:2-phosphosulfolactate phosphatase
MEIKCSSLLAGARDARGLAVVIDVYRAFTCAPVLFSLGIRQSILVSSPQDALELKARDKDRLLIGEVDGKHIPGFDYGNSPSILLKAGEAVFKGKTVVQRTSAGVQGALMALDAADEVLLASFVLAQATCRYILDRQPPHVSIVAMGWNMVEEAPEDEWCAKYLAHLLGVSDYDYNAALEEILFCYQTQKYKDPDKPYFPFEDPLICLQRDIYDFVLRARRKEDLVVVEKV